jgi:hypothetical protein
VNDTAARPPTTRLIEDAALEVQTRVRQAADHASVGDYRRAHAEAEARPGPLPPAQGDARGRRRAARSHRQMSEKPITPGR